MDYKEQNDKIGKMLSGFMWASEGDKLYVEKSKPHWEQLASMVNSLVLVFDVHKNTFIYVSGDYLQPYGIDSADLIIKGHIPVLEIIHPEDLRYGFLIREKLYATLTSFHPDKIKEYKATHEFRVKNLKGEWVRVIEQEQVIETDEHGNIWLLLSVVDIDASYDMESVRSHLYNHMTGDQLFFDLSDILNEPLTEREWEVLHMMHKGLLSKEIAHKLNVSIHTINTHRQHILRKLGANNTVEALNLVKRLGLKR
ncbi:MAG: LuxR C-terminal-related transcriptional regulator [Bacteroides sp.]|nr:LuxR C-terminal-related transcriptional regulator [Bacteroides sp.]